MSDQQKNIKAFILAGGKSSRMGTDKGLVKLCGQTFTEHIISALRSCFDEICIVSSNKDYEQFGVEVIADSIPSIGPAGGVHAALRNLKTEKAFIMSCDMPFVTEQAIRILTEHPDEVQIHIALHKGELQPLFGVYNKNCQEKWEELLQAGNYKMRDLVTHFKLQTTDTKNNPAFSDVLFVNINTRHELELAKKFVDNEN